MAIANLEASKLLGKQVVLTNLSEGVRSEHQGKVIAVIEVVPGTRATASLMLEEGGRSCDYFDLEEITINAIL
jgi:short-subunit dehydrogenase